MLASSPEGEIILKNNVNVLVAEDLRNAHKDMDRVLREREDINLLPSARDGLRAIESLKQHEVDLFLLDLVLSEIDGIGVLRMLQSMNLPSPPTVVLITALSSPLIINQAAKLGATHTLLKPCDPSYMIDRALEVYRDARSHMIVIGNRTYPLSEIQRIIVEALHAVGMPPQLLGYEYLRSAILAALKESSALHGITTYLYPLLAEGHNSTPQKIERSIRHAIESTWNRTSVESIHRLFGSGMSQQTTRPTNSEFIARMTDYVLLNCN